MASTADPDADGGALRPRPDPAPALARLVACGDDPAGVLAGIVATLRRGGREVMAAVPLLAWPLIAAARRAGAAPPADALDALGRALDAWEDRHGAAAGRPGRLAVAAQAWLVQDLHCLADLRHLAGLPGGAAWSGRGHRAEAALHRLLWDDDDACYADRGDDGRLRSAADGDRFAPLLLLDTPPERVAALADACSAATVAALAREPVTAWLAAVGLRRHRREAPAAAILAALSASPDGARLRAAALLVT